MVLLLRRKHHSLLSQRLSLVLRSAYQVFLVWLIRSASQQSQTLYMSRSSLIQEEK